MMLTFFIMGVIVTLVGLFQFDAQVGIRYKLAGVLVIAIGVAMMVFAITWGAL